MAPWLRRTAVVLALAAPPVALVVGAWPDGGADGAATSGEPFTEPVTEAVSVEVGGVTLTLAPHALGACLALQRGGGTGAGCGTLADLASFPAGGSGMSDGRTSTIEVYGLAPPDADALVITLADGTVVEGEVVDVPGRSERLYFASITTPGDLFGQQGAGLDAQLLDGDGNVIDRGGM